MGQQLEPLVEFAFGQYRAPRVAIRVAVITKVAYAMLAGFHAERNVKMGFPIPDDPSKNKLSPL
jgi:hypothetical protein